MVASLYAPTEANNALWVFLEIEGDGFTGVSIELLSKGRELADRAGWTLCGLLLGCDISDRVNQAYSYGADEVWLLDHTLLGEFDVCGYSHAIIQAIKKGKPSVFLLGATANGRDLAGRLAVRLRTGLNADCTDLILDEDRGVLISEVTGFGGGVIALLESAEHSPQMSTVRPGVFVANEPDPSRQGELVEMKVKLKKADIRSRVVERHVGEGVDLTQAPVLICGGRGIDGDFESLRELAALLEGEVGATRPPVDEGHIERERQIGQTGVVCRPKVVLNFGISGAFHFIVGIQDAETIIAINSDPEAPIFNHADYCIVADTHKILPALIKTLQRERESIHA
ncbi:MAG: electron transfer flavoprotein subunit alpha/FixB family protein [Anaerolineales bacterium]|nr:electron transfer flavoprotein subunit alpha/FixB family protein [Anaerolineales bacterium]